MLEGQLDRPFFIAIFLGIREIGGAIVGGGGAAKIGELLPKPQLLGDLNFPEPLAR